MRSKRVAKLRYLSKELEKTHIAIQTNPFNERLLMHEREYRQYILRYWEEEESTMKQKSRDQCISLGDSNTTYFTI